MILLSAGSLAAQPITSSKAIPLGLLRLRTETKAGEAAPVAASKFDVCELSANESAGVSRRTRNNADYLVIEGGRNWMRPLRGNGRNVSFISFQAFGSENSLVEIGGAKIGVIASDIPGYAQIMVKRGPENWSPLSIQIPLEVYDGRPLATLPVLTLRLDPEAGVFDIFNGAMLSAADIPLGSDPLRVFRVTAGLNGAWVIGLVQSDENPFFEDANANGIDDGFEEKQGGELSKKLAASERKQLATEWRKQQLATGVPALFSNQPRPDRK